MYRRLQEVAVGRDLQTFGCTSTGASERLHRQTFQRRSPRGRHYGRAFRVGLTARTTYLKVGHVQVAVRMLAA